MLFYLYLSHPQKQSKVSIDSRPGLPYGGQSWSPRSLLGARPPPQNNGLKSSLSDSTRTGRPGTVLGTSLWPPHICYLKASQGFRPSGAWGLYAGPKGPPPYLWKSQVFFLEPYNHESSPPAGTI